jgi:hypothetical protein
MGKEKSYAPALLGGAVPTRKGNCYAVDGRGQRKKEESFVKRSQSWDCSLLIQFLPDNFGVRVGD